MLLIFSDPMRRFISLHYLIILLLLIVIVILHDNNNDIIINSSSLSFFSSTTKLPFLLHVEALSTSSTNTKRRRSISNNNNETSSSSSTCYGSPLIIPHTITSRNKLSPPKSNKLIIAHRGASVHLPEHSLAAYRLAYELGADYIEPDLVVTKDKQLIALHKMDLNITTNVHDIFGVNRSKYSKFTNTTGYWSYEFTLNEIKQLRIKQRLPNVRSKQYDGLFDIPTLTEILQLQKEWNTNIIPKRCSSSSSSVSSESSSLSDDEQLQLQQVGIYAELKDTAWLMEDTGIDLVDIFFQHQQDNVQLWKDTIGGQHSCRATHHLSDYKIPPLILQSFDGQALQKVYQQWDTRTEGLSSIGGTTIPIPPMVLLVDKNKCNTDSFWYEVEEIWRDIISGIGPDKVCLQNNGNNFFIEHAEMAKLAIHPWTVRPEMEYHIGYNTVNEELEDLFCRYNIHGIFTEDVSDAILASIKVMDKVECNIFEEEEKLEHSNKGRHKNSANNNNQEDGAGGGGVSVGFVLLLLLIPFGIIGCSVFLVLQWQQKMRLENLQKLPTNDDDDDDEDDGNNFHDEVDEDDDDDDNDIIIGGRKHHHQQVGFHDDIIGDEEEEQRQHEIT